MCWPSTPGFAQRTIQKRSGSGYVHAAIVTSASPPECAEFLAGWGLVLPTGLTTTSLSALIVRYGHVAVLRQPMPPRVQEVKILSDFVSKLKGRSWYALRKAITSPNLGRSRSSQHQQLLTQYFAGKAPKREIKRSYFCSEFVAECFIEMGYLHESAAVIYWPEGMTPGDLVRDNTFGVVAGFIHAPRYVMPKEEPLQHQTAHAFIFGSQTNSPTKRIRRKLIKRAVVQGRRVKLPGRQLRDISSNQPPVRQPRFRR